MRDMNNELQEWEARGRALENGAEWNESHRLVGYANSVSAVKAKELVESGVYRRCGQCSHPHQSIYHLTSAEGIPGNAPERPVDPLRINVAVTPECLEALERVMAAEQVSLTEAVMRLVRYGDFVYLSAKVDGAEILLRQGDDIREVHLL